MDKSDEKLFECASRILSGMYAGSGYDSNCLSHDVEEKMGEIIEGLEAARSNYGKGKKDTYLGPM